MHILNFLSKKSVSDKDTDPIENKSIDTISTIYLDDEQNYFLSLDYPDEHEYKELLEIVRAKLRSWMLMDIDLAKSIDRGVDNSLSIKLATIDLKLQDLETEANKRDEIINYIKDSYVSASNANQPMIWCV